MAVPNWETPVIVSACLIVLHGFLWLGFRTRIAWNLFGRTQVDQVKDAVIKAVENNLMATSFIMTTVVGLLVDGHEIETVDGSFDPEFRKHLRLTFVTLCVWCLGMSISCLIYCLLTIHYFHPLRGDVPSVAFLVWNLRTIGTMFVLMIESYFIFALAVGAWVLGTYAWAGGIMYLIILALFTGMVLFVWLGLGRMHPDSEIFRELRDTIDDIVWEVDEPISHLYEARDEASKPISQPTESKLARMTLGQLGSELDKRQAVAAKKKVHVAFGGSGGPPS
ncbi:unnamed protein product [Symbiodinium natans]|uniref:Transmembrane protein n=1 Tax=Symbiodinium natans TaxID=878477 RepID=A0A812SHQ7_9DINO|nr:unnamed protein product [Symbiodinium natans]